MKMHANPVGLLKLWLLNFVGNAAALAAWYFWLLIPDAHGWQVAGSALAAACVIFLVVWLRAGTLAYFRLTEFRDDASVWPAFRRGLRHIIALALWAAVIAIVEWYLWRLRRYAPQFGVWFWQKMPGSLRIGTPRQFAQWTDWKVWFVFWVIVPAIGLPIATTVAAMGLKLGRMARSLRVLRRPLYWLWFGVLMLFGAYLPYKLIWWVSYKGDLRTEAVSMGLRFFAAYLVVTIAWIALVCVVGWRVEKEDLELNAQNEAIPSVS